MEASPEIEETRGRREQIIISELPYQVKKANLVEKIAPFDPREEAGGHLRYQGRIRPTWMRIVIELRRDAQTYVVMNNLMRHTALRQSFNTIMLVLVDGQPQVLL
ncbi:MAG: hypothetical protein CM1200mP22_30620 [Dehalococcoidia bacterium]|nr:MAG: hypothetical protein CM1200mP22_30620 [Dehalococcoidia bacterium]